MQRNRNGQNQAKRLRSELSESDTSTSMANNAILSAVGDTCCTGFDKDLHTLDTLLEFLSKDDNATQRAVSIILNHESFKSRISDIL